MTASPNTTEYHPAPSKTPANLPTQSTTIFPSLPPEIHIEIMSHCDAVTATCLGLTSKRFYPMYKSIHGTVKLYEGGYRILGSKRQFRS